MLLLIGYIILQLADGILSYFGVRYGVAMEGNPILNYASYYIGFLPTLIIAKSIAIALGVSLYRNRCIHMLGTLTFVMSFVVSMWLIAISQV